MARIGIFGGTFNPPHFGHLIAAEQVVAELGLARMLFVPASIPPHKSREGLPEVHHRLTMLELAIQSNRHFEVSDIEISRGGVSYTVETIRQLAAMHPRDELFLVIGMDMLQDFSTWRSPEEILERADLVALTRPEFPLPRLEPQIMRQMQVCRIPEIGISSSDIRRKVKEGKSIRYLVPTGVEEYIHRHGLYL